MSQEKIKRAQEHLDVQVIAGSGSSYSALKKAGIEQADMLVAVTDSDEVNLLACVAADRFNVNTKIARVKNKEFLKSSNPLNAESLKIDLIIHPESAVAQAVQNLLKQSAATDIVEFAEGRIVLIGIHLDKKCDILGKTLADVAAEYSQLRFRAVAIVRKDRTIIPGGTDSYLRNDRVYFICRKENLADVIRLSGKENTNIENVMILGGGQTGAEIARRLDRELNVKIIESNIDKTDELAEYLPNSLVIRGDARDMNLLALEGIIDMDAFISVTGDDETNIITSLMARHLEVPRIIALINKTDYTPIIPTIGIDAYVSKQLVTVDNILKFIRRGAIANVASIPGITAEIIEFIAGDNSKVTRMPVRKLNLPKGAILGAVSRDGDVFIPIGDSELMAGDKVVVFAIPSAIRDIEKLFN